MQLPQIHQDANPDSYRDHKELILNELSLVKLSALVPWWQNRLFGADSNFYYKQKGRRCFIMLQP
jgi:hypothetical protein